MRGNIGVSSIVEKIKEVRWLVRVLRREEAEAVILIWRMYVERKKERV